MGPKPLTVEEKARILALREGKVLILSKFVVVLAAQKQLSRVPSQSPGTCHPELFQCTKFIVDPPKDFSCHKSPEEFFTQEPTTHGSPAEKPFHSWDSTQPAKRPSHAQPCGGTQAASHPYHVPQEIRLC
ncbi:hypothetical protein Hamer_G007747 [Homarus americanus]|uniref:Uncharacterized protein n=1 Tax=Homarus americanus TaxID=6706 RepID=A0A8J5JRC3_HOMAM|nr:hypothetical protein Hamer_G007747 [Homarus americanus]